MSNQKYVNKIRNVKCDICNKDLITGNKAEAVQNGQLDDIRGDVPRSRYILRILQQKFAEEDKEEMEKENERQ
jgi:hypothetical protein